MVTVGPRDYTITIDGKENTELNRFYAKVMHPRTRVALLGYLIATERSKQDERELFARCLSGDDISSGAVVSSLLGLGVERAFIGYTPSRYDTNYHFGQLSVLVFIARLAGFAGTLIVVDEAAAIADLRSTSRRKAYKVLDEIIKNSFNFSSLNLVIAYLPALFTQLNADCAEFGLDYQLRWLDVLRDRVLEVEPLTKSDLVTLFDRIAALHSYAYGDQAGDRTAKAQRLISESILHRWSTRTFVRATLNLLDTNSN